MFTPDSIRKSSYVPPVVFSKLMVANEDVIPGEKSILKVDLDDTQELVLDFADLEYISSAGLRVLLKLQKVMNKKGGFNNEVSAM